MSAYQSGTLKPCPGPDRHPKRPVFAMPPGACDTHVHVFGPQAEFPFSEQRSYTPEDCTYDDLMQLHATLGIDRAVIVHGGAHGTDNQATLAALDRNPGKLRGVAVIPSGLPRPGTGGHEPARHARLSHVDGGERRRFVRTSRAGWPRKPLTWAGTSCCTSMPQPNWWMWRRSSCKFEARLCSITLPGSARPKASSQSHSERCCGCSILTVAGSSLPAFIACLQNPILIVTCCR